MLAELEQALLDRLSALDLAVEPFPDRPDSYQVRHENGALLVTIAGRAFSDPEQGPVYARTVRVVLSLLVYSLRGHSGAYTYLEQIEQLLSGWEYGGYRFFPVSEDIGEEVANNVWLYMITYEGRREMPLRLA